MGQEFGTDGRFVKWSNLFDYSNLQTLQASLWLPTARNLFITTDNGKLPQGASDDQIIDFNINKYILPIGNLRGVDEAKRLRKIADLIIDMYDEVDKHTEIEKPIVRIVFDDARKGDVVNEIIQNIITHEGTKLSYTTEEAAYKNSVSSNIKNIIQDLRNMTMAYQPITMKALLKLASESEKGAMTARMSLINPTTKYLMQVLNMVGKSVIGITAVGEKVFFNLNYYFNEGLRSGNPEWIKNLQFRKTFNRIQGRSTGNIESATKTSVANINFAGIENLKLVFDDQVKLHNYAIKELGFVGQDLNDAQRQTLLEFKVEAMKDRDLMEELGISIKEAEPVDLLISLLLSAATDNAKELILSKINAGDNLAKCHLYLLMLGFSINDVVKYMTSPFINLVNILSEANMLDNYMSEIRVEDAADLARGIINPSKFFKGYTYVEVDGKLEKLTQGDMLYDELSSAKYNGEEVLSLLLSGDDDSITSLLSFVQHYIKYRMDHNLPSLDSLSGKYTRQIVAFSDFVERLIYQIKKARSKYDNASDFDLDSEEFKLILEGANETSTLGQTFLKLNQGIPSSEEDMLANLRNIEQAMTKREDKFKINKYLFQVSKNFELLSDDEKNEELVSRNKNIEKLIDSLIENNPYLDHDDVLNTLRMAHAYGMMNGFNFADWISNKQLSGNDIVNQQFLVTDNSDIPPISYRDLAIKYYNLIKCTWNVFDVIDKVPQYNSILKLYNYLYSVDKIMSVKSRLTNRIHDDILKENKFIDKTKSSQIKNYVNDLLIIKFFDSHDYTFKVPMDKNYMDSNYDIQTSRGNKLIELNTAYGRAAFKMIFEDCILSLRDTGSYGNIKIPTYKTNRLLQDLSITPQLNGSPQLTVELDLMQINATENSQIQFQLYLDGFEQLKKVSINGISIANWLILYNLFNSQNQYGSDRLTNLFKYAVNSDDSVLTEFFRTIGEYDFMNTEQVLDDLGYNIEDLNIRMAPTISYLRVGEAKAPIIKVRKRDGSTEYMKRTSKGKYFKYRVFPDCGDPEIMEQRNYNYQVYQAIKMVNLDFNQILKLQLVSNDLETLMNALSSYVQRGILKIYEENC